MYDPEDFYGEPSEFEMQVEEFKESLRNSVKQEFLDEMERLKKENAELREFRDQKAQYERDHRAAMHKYDAAIASAKRDAERMRANELVRSLCLTGYRANTIYSQRPKCGKCDDNRKIHYTSPMGRKCSEDCACAAMVTSYEPKEVAMFRFNVNRDNVGFKYFTRCESDRDYDFYDYAADVYEEQEKTGFENVNRYRAVFIEKANCQAYCDWMNEKKREKEKAGAGTA